MISNLVPVRKINERQRWDFASHNPEYYKMLKRIETSKWPSTNLGSLVDFKYGASVAPDYVDDGVLFIRAQNIREHGLDLSDKRYLPTDLSNIDSYRLTRKDVLITRSGINVGDAAAIDETTAGSIHGSYSIRLRLRNQDTTSKFLAIALNSNALKTQILAAKGRSAQPNINIAELSSLQIPLPPRPIQDRIAAQVMQDAYATRRTKLAKAEALLGGIEAYVYKKLEIAPESVKEQTRFLKSVTEIHGERFDVDFNLGFQKFDPYLEHVQPVEKVAHFPKETQDPSANPNTPFQYIDIASINIQTGEIDEVKEIMGVDAPSRARQVVHTGDVIVSTVRPTRGAIALIPSHMDEFICSTGFTIVRPNHQIIGEYLHTALRLSTTLEQFGRRSTGSSYPAILENDIRGTLIPVPNKQVQHQIATEVSRRRSQASQLRSEAESIVTEAKARVERMILGEEAVA